VEADVGVDKWLYFVVKFEVEPPEVGQRYYGVDVDLETAGEVAIEWLMFRLCSAFVYC
jgi:hypothetical protein